MFKNISPYALFLLGLAMPAVAGDNFVGVGVRPGVQGDDPAPAIFAKIELCRAWDDATISIRPALILDRDKKELRLPLTLDFKAAAQNTFFTGAGLATGMDGGKNTKESSAAAPYVTAGLDRDLSKSVVFSLSVNYIFQHGDRNGDTEALLTVGYRF